MKTALIFIFLVMASAANALTFDEQHCSRGSVTACQDACNDGSEWACAQLKPKYYKQPLSYYVKGEYNCSAGIALRSAENVGHDACEARSNGWFMGDYNVVGVSKVPSGSCGHGSYGANIKYQYTIHPICWKQR